MWAAAAAPGLRPSCLRATEGGGGGLTGGRSRWGALLAGLARNSPSHTGGKLPATRCHPECRAGDPATGDPSLQDGWKQVPGTRRAGGDCTHWPEHGSPGTQQEGSLFCPQRLSSSFY